MKPCTDPAGCREMLAAAHDADIVVCINRELVADGDSALDITVFSGAAVATQMQVSELVSALRGAADDIEAKTKTIQAEGTP